MPWIAKKRTKQPSRLLTPDLSAFGLRVAFAFNAADPPRNAISGALNTGTASGGGLDFRGGEGGVAAFSPAVQNRALTYTNVMAGANITVFAIINDIEGLGAGRGFVGCDSSTTGNRTWLLQANASNQLDFTVFNTGSTPFVAAGGALVTQQPVVVVGRLNGTAVQSFMNGVQMGTATLTGTARTTTGKPVAVGYSGRNNTNGMRGDIYEVFVVDGAVPDTLIAEWNSPEALRSAMYAPRRIWVPFSGGGGGSNTDLVVQDASHAHAADALVLVTDSALQVADAAHAQSADQQTLYTDLSLLIAEAQHAHAADNITLEADGSTTLIVADSLHAHTADNIGLTSAIALAIASSIHAHAADNLTLSISGGGYTDIELAIKILRNRKELDAVAGLYIVYDDDGVTVLYSAAAWEDTAGTIPYRGGDVRRIDRLE
jgi:hypothetical protein